MIKKDDFVSKISDKELTWNTQSRHQEYKSVIFNVNKVERNSESGKASTFVELDCPEWVMVIPLFKDDEENYFIMERQFRHGSETITTEFPAGLVEKGEDALMGAKRELLEETGCIAKKYTLLAKVNPNPAFMNNTQYFYLAEDLELVSKQSLDTNEEIDVISVKVEDAINNFGREKSWENGIMCSAMGLFLRYERENNIL